MKMDAAEQLARQRPPTHLERAFRVFEEVAPAPLSARGLAALLRVWPETAYNYIARLKRLKKIEIVPGSGRFPSYRLTVGATAPAPDQRGGRRASRPPTAIARWKKIGT